VSSVVLNERTSDYQADPVGRPNLGSMDGDMVKLYQNDGRVVAALNALLRDDDTIKDQLLRLRMMHPEVIALMAQRGDWQAKAPVKFATTEDIDLDGGGTFDGYVAVNGNRALVKDQDDAAENGIYLVNTAGAWTRATDADGAGELDNAFVQVLNGTVNGSTAWVVAGEDLTPGTDDIDWAPYAWQGAQPGGAGSGGSIGINVKSSPYLAVGDGVADDTAAIQSAIDAAPLGGIVWFPVGTYLITGRLSVPAGVTLVGETRRGSILKAATIAAPGIDLDGDGAALRDLQFLSQDANRFFIKSNNINDPRVTGCYFNRAHVSFSNDTDTTLVGGLIQGNYFTGSYLPWVASLNIIEVRGLRGVQILGNQMIGCVSPYRFIKIQASIFWLTGTVGDQYTKDCVISGNVISGTMTSTKQVVDMFDGCGQSVFSHNIIHMESSGAGFTVFVEQKAGDTPSNLFSSRASEWLVTDNVFIGNPTDSLVGVYGAYSLAWEGTEQSVTVSRNQFYCTIPGTMTRGVEFRGVHHVHCHDNLAYIDGFGAIFRVFGAGSCKTASISRNMATAGQIYIWGNAVTSGGDAYTGATEQLNVCNNTLKNFRSDHGGIEVINMVGTPDLVAIGNHLDSDVGTGTLALIYLSNNTMRNVIAVGNVGDCGAAARNRLLESTSTHTLKHEYFNSWQTKVLLEFDTTLNRVTIGDASTSVAEFYELGSGNQRERYTRVAGFTRHIEVVTATTRLLYAYNAAGVLIDNYWNETLAAGGRVTCARPFDVGGPIRPTSDAAHTCGDSTMRWTSFYGQGGLFTGLVTKTSNNTPQDGEHVIEIDCTSGSLVLTLAALTAARHGKDILVRRIDTAGGNTCTFTRTGSDTILDTSNVSQTSVTLAVGGLMWLRANHTAVRYTKML
jgi:hypothetical protein